MSMRSILMVKAAQELTGDYAAAQTNAGALIADLVDTDFCNDLAQVRSNAINILSQARQSQMKVNIYIGIHRLDTPECTKDLESILPLAPDGIFLPHCRNGADVQHLAGRLAVLEAKNDLADGSTKIIASAVSEASAIFDLKHFQGASRRLIALSWNAGELAKSLGLQTAIDVDGALLPPLSMARALMLYAAKAAQVCALDTPALHITETGAFQRECAAARRDGFDGKIGLDLSQINIINDVYSA